jgi:hypothetical protein
VSPKPAVPVQNGWAGPGHDGDPGQGRPIRAHDRAGLGYDSTPTPREARRARRRRDANPQVLLQSSGTAEFSELSQPDPRHDKDQHPKTTTNNSSSGNPVLSYIDPGPSCLFRDLGYIFHAAFG